MKYRGHLDSWSGDHGIIVADEGFKAYLHGVEVPRSFVPKLGTRLTFEVVRDDPDPAALPYARNVLLRVK